MATDLSNFFWKNISVVFMAALPYIMICSYKNENKWKQVQSSAYFAIKIVEKLENCTCDVTLGACVKHFP
jgi:hypothetical protein